MKTIFALILALVFIGVQTDADAYAQGQGSSTGQSTVENPQCQDLFLTALASQQVVVSIYLVNGIKLQGLIELFDKSVVVLLSGSNRQMVYKTAISIILPTAPVPAAC